MEGTLGCREDHQLASGMVSVWFLGVEQWVLLTALLVCSRIKLAAFLQPECPADENHVFPLLQFSHYLHSCCSSFGNWYVSPQLVPLIWHPLKKCQYIPNKSGPEQRWRAPKTGTEMAIETAEYLDFPPRGRK